MDGFDGFGQFVVIAIVVVISIVGNAIKKMNEHINRKRMKFNPRHLEDQIQRQERTRQASEGKRQARPRTVAGQLRSERPDEQPSHRAAQPAARGVEAKKAALAETIMRQLEGLMPPEIAEARRRARGEQAPAPVPQPAAGLVQRSAPERPARSKPSKLKTKLKASEHTPRRSLAEERKKILHEHQAARTHPGAAAFERPVKQAYKRPTQEAYARSGQQAYDRPVHSAYERPEAARARGSALTRINLHSREELRKAILWREILGPPLALRESQDSGVSQ